LGLNLNEGTQFFRLTGGKVDIMGLSQLNDGLEAHVAFEMAVEIDEGDIRGNHVTVLV